MFMQNYVTLENSKGYLLPKKGKEKRNRIGIKGS